MRESYRCTVSAIWEEYTLQSRPKGVTGCHLNREQILSRFSDLNDIAYRWHSFTMALTYSSLSRSAKVGRTPLPNIASTSACARSCTSGWRIMAKMKVKMIDTVCGTVIGVIRITSSHRGSLCRFRLKERKMVECEDARIYKSSCTHPNIL